MKFKKKNFLSLGIQNAYMYINVDVQKCSSFTSKTTYKKLRNMFKFKGRSYVELK